jgi:hypothetical protein
MESEDLWFPVDGGNRVVGRFIDHSFDHTNSDGTKRVVNTTLFQHKVSANSADIAHDQVKAHTKAYLVGRCPQGWAHYEKLKASQESGGPGVGMGVGVSAKDVGIKGTPIEDAALHCGWNNDRLRWFKQQGMMTVQQVADLSDADCQGLGRGAVGWRKKAKEYLAGQAAA